MTPLFELPLLAWVKYPRREQKYTSVSKAVFPAPLGPISKNDGRVVEEAERYIAKWSTSGIASAMMNVMAIAKGDGPIREDSQLCGSVQGMIIFVVKLIWSGPRRWEIWKRERQVEASPRARPCR